MNQFYTENQIGLGVTEKLWENNERIDILKRLRMQALQVSQLNTLNNSTESARDPYWKTNGLIYLKREPTRSDWIIVNSPPNGQINNSHVGYHQTVTTFRFNREKL